MFFPSRVFDDAGAYAAEYFALFSRAAASVDGAAMAAAGDLLAERVAAGATILSCGNGGSAAIANHLACDCLKGARHGTTIAPRVVSLSATVELITAIANDIGYEDVFAYQLESLGKPGDVLIAISSSGASPNILRAIEAARARGMATIALTGFEGGGARTTADVALHVDCQNYGVVEDLHQSMMHILAQYLRHRHLAEPGDLGRVKF